MKKINVTASKNYDVVIGKNLLEQVGNFVSSICQPNKIAIISDSNVWPLYGSIVEASLADKGICICSYVFPAGEASKNGNTYLSILNFLADQHITRSDMLIALGGGVVGDITGFAAATFLRGIGYVQIPTSLLAMVDSSVGGKTAIDLPSGKNLVGAFYQPKLVLCDINTLDTLPDEFFIDGCAEIIKYGVLYDPALFAQLNQSGLNFDRESVICRCVELKRNVVNKDEFDTGERQKLNFGHTLGHGVEVQSNFSISHGRAVAIGMAIVTKAALSIGLCNKDTYDSILTTICKFKLPVQTSCSAETLYNCALSDKKRFGTTVNLIVPKEVGNCTIYTVPTSELSTFIEAGL